MRGGEGMPEVQRRGLERAKEIRLLGTRIEIEEPERSGIVRVDEDPRRTVEPAGSLVDPT